MFHSVASFCAVPFVAASTCLASVSTAPAASPSFDCDKASAVDELAICSDAIPFIENP